MTAIQSPVESPFVPESVGDRIQHARRVLGVFLGWDITQVHLADFLGVSQLTVLGLEGDSVPVDPYAAGLCEALGIRRDFLVAGAFPMTQTLSSEVRRRWRSVLDGAHTPPVIAASTGSA